MQDSQTSVNLSSNIPDSDMSFKPGTRDNSEQYNMSNEYLFVDTNSTQPFLLKDYFGYYMNEVERLKLETQKYIYTPLNINIQQEHDRLEYIDSLLTQVANTYQVLISEFKSVIIQTITSLKEALPSGYTNSNIEDILGYITNPMASLQSNQFAIQSQDVAYKINVGNTTSNYLPQQIVTMERPPPVTTPVPVPIPAINKIPSQTPSNLPIPQLKNMNNNNNSLEGIQITETKPSDRKRRTSLRPPRPGLCLGCGATTSCHWRVGPSGPNTLCNPCGLKYGKTKKQEKSPDSVKRPKRSHNNEGKIAIIKSEKDNNK